ncbi:MAG: TetR family transcriptional regulator C-terminal domain-containing protein [Anaerolineae bacterium]|nr:TetR family transcriptional regulator C-terminal domain-containing protein [Anaerolineae bacterium]
MNSLRAAPPQILSLPEDIIANFLAGAELSLMAWWLNSDQPYPVEDIAGMTQQLILRGVLDGMDVSSPKVKT